MNPTIFFFNHQVSTRNHFMEIKMNFTVFYIKVASYSLGLKKSNSKPKEREEKNVISCAQAIWLAIAERAAFYWKRKNLIQDPNGV